MGFPFCEFSTRPHRLLWRAILALRVVLLAGEVVLVLFEGVAQIEYVLVREAIVALLLTSRSIHATLSPANSVGLSSTFADEVQFPLITGPDRTNVLSLGDF